MPLSFAVALLILFVLIALRFITRRSATAQMRALITDTKDPAASRARLRTLFAAEQTKETTRRAELWQEAQTNVRAAKDLRRRLQADLDEEDEVRTLLADSQSRPSAEELKQLQQDRTGLLEQIARVDALISRLRS